MYHDVCGGFEKFVCWYLKQCEKLKGLCFISKNSTKTETSYGNKNKNKNNNVSKDQKLAKDIFDIISTFLVGFAN